MAQAVAKQYFEPIAERFFYPDSYGYRPGKSALGAIAATRKRCWKFAYVLEFDIVGLFGRCGVIHFSTKQIYLYSEKEIPFLKQGIFISWVKNQISPVLEQIIK